MDNEKQILRDCFKKKELIMDYIRTVQGGVKLKKGILIESPKEDFWLTGERLIKFRKNGTTIGDSSIVAANACIDKGLKAKELWMRRHIKE